MSVSKVMKASIELDAVPFHPPRRGRVLPKAEVARMDLGLPAKEAVDHGLAVVVGRDVPGEREKVAPVAFVGDDPIDGGAVAARQGVLEGIKPVADQLYLGPGRHGDLIH